VIHCIGNVTTHEVYLREWAKATKAIVISVDYTLAPEAKYPQSLQECYYVYKWLLDPNNVLGMYSSLSLSLNICLFF
jgi:acetyl esterase/lipase